ncbi:AAA family ATPase [Fundidesulfovibrio terrae]|uniref:AAA family ATPase n=1 Tax=Fundidesulfovibrio terrae TaxID=2922866 RepID=UPI001FAF7BD2|nr:AAA family ATPase [Fundidesulfovibrio terrae]
MGALYYFGSVASQQSVGDDSAAIEAALAHMPARQEKFTAGVGSIGEKEDSTKPGFYTGFDIIAHKSGIIINLDLLSLVWVFLDSFLTGKLGFVSGAPEVGKPTFLIYLAALIANCLDWFGDHLVPGGKGKVLAVFYEVDKCPLWRRLQRAFAVFRWSWPCVSLGFSFSLITQNFMGNIFAVPAAGQEGHQ